LAIEDRPDGLLNRSDGCKPEQFEARHRGRFVLESTSSGRLMLWTAGRPDGMTRRPDGWQGTEISDLQTVQNLLETLLNSRIPDEKHLYKEVILSNRMWPITN
jgi:hypothetical protein